MLLMKLSKIEILLENILAFDIFQKRISKLSFV